MRFVETPIFTKEIRALLKDDDYRALQTALLFRPEQGAIIPGSGGLRKLRWGGLGKGKRGGNRIVYYWDPKTEVVYMLFIYSKTYQADLTRAQVKLLSRIVKEEFK
jgi:mRNA-degrading endonuclease RelE of RelBE toxin-antitoxin system